MGFTSIGGSYFRLFPRIQMPNGWFKHVKTPGLNCLAHLDNCVKIAVAHTEVLETRGDRSLASPSSC